MEIMKVSVDYWFKNCKGCPFGDSSGLNVVCKVEQCAGSRDDIPGWCPLRQDEKDKIYKIRSYEIQ